MVLILLLLLIVPIVELAVIIQVGQWIGVLPTIALLIADSLLGAWLLRRQGRAAWHAFRAAIAAGRLPARESIDGVLVIGGGALMLTPGFVSDLVGMVMILPPTRARLRARLLKRSATFVGASARPGPARRRYDVETSAVEID